MNSEIPDYRKNTLRTLFFATLYLSTFTFGGGYVIITLLKKKFVNELEWISEEEMIDLVAISQSAPGAVAVNGAIVVGYKVAGIPGVICSVMGAVLPPLVILTIISFFYNIFRSNAIVQTILTGMKAAVSAVIISVVFDMGKGIVQKKNFLNIVIMIFAFMAISIFHVKIIFLILVSIIIGISTVLFEHRKGFKQ